MRAMVSELLPAPNGTISLIGRSGHSAPGRRRYRCQCRGDDHRRDNGPSQHGIALRSHHANLLGLAQAFEQRRPQQELARQRRIFGLAPQLVVVAPAHRRIALLQQPLVADGLRLGVLDRDMPALPFVAVELRFVGFAVQDAGQLVGEIEGVVHAAVQSHAADRAVDVGGVAGEQHAADAELLRDALMHGVEIAAADVEVAVDAEEPLAAAPAVPRGASARSRRRRSSVGKWMRQRSGGPFQWNRLEYSTGSEM